MAFLVGAGASYGAGLVAPHQPPLGNQLFGELQRGCPMTWGRLRGARAALFKTDFEKGMDQLWADQPDEMVDLLNDMGRYFIEFEPAPRQESRYAELLFFLTKTGLLSNSAFASLNYECILEIAAWRLGLGLAFAPSPPQPRALWILKPHGSCNFLPASEPRGSGNVFKVQGTAQIWDGPVAAKTIDAARLRYRSGQYFLNPVMSLFAPGKLTPSARDFIEAIRERWRQWVLSSESVVIIGSRPNLADGHVWDPIVESAAHVFYLSGIEDDYSELSRRLSGRLQNLGRFFDDAGLDALTTAISQV